MGRDCDVVLAKFEINDDISRLAGCWGLPCPSTSLTLDLIWENVWECCS